jgi:hypothetical protein
MLWSRANSAYADIALGVIVKLQRANPRKFYGDGTPLLFHHKRQIRGLLPRLDTLLLAMPISWKGTLQQYVGRLHRLHVNKSEVHVYDYADVMVPMLARMYKKRLAGYSALGYRVPEIMWK